MGLRCLIGHDFGDPQIERDRDEQGEEVVVTIHEYTECTRCGHRRTISENKEVTSIASTESEATGFESESDADAPETEVAMEETLDDVSAEEDDGVILDDDDAEPERQHGEWPDSGIETDATDRTEADTGSDTQAAETRAEDVSADTSERKDAGEIIDADAESEHEHEGESESENEDEDEDEDETEDRSETGDRPESDTATDTEEWPEVDGADEGFSAETTGGETTDVDFESEYSIDPAADDGSVSDEAVVGSTGATTPRVETTDGPSGETGITSDESGTTPTHGQRLADADVVFVCPECGYTTPASGASLRPGDICPECQLGYLTEREE